MMPVAPYRKSDRFTVEAVERVSSLYIGHPRLDFEFELHDRVMLTITALQRLAEHRVLAVPGQVLRNHLFSRCELLAVDGILRVLETKPSEWFDMMRVTCRRHASWTMFIKHIKRQVRAGRDDLDEYVYAVLGAHEAAQEYLGLERTLEQWKRATKKAMGALGMADEVEDDEEVVQNLQLYRQAVFPQHGGLFRSHDGRIYLGDRQVRDGLARELGIKRPRPAPLKSHVWADVDVPVDESQDDETPEGSLHHLDRQDQLRRLRRVLDVREARAKRGSAAEAAARHYMSIKSGETTIRKLARRLRISRSALQEALRKLEADVSRDLSTG